MPDKNRIYAAIDLKSFFASVECVDRGLDPLTTNLVVADETRTEKTICLAISPSLKAYGLPGRARLFEVVQRVRSVNNARRSLLPGHRFVRKSHFSTELQAHPDCEVSYIVAPPRMSRYTAYSTRIYNIYTRYVSAEDIHVYSIDEVFIDMTDYLRTYRMTARELTMKLINEVLSETGITATAGIGPNMYLCKVAMDIKAKHIPADANGVRIAELDEMSYRRELWSHTPLTDFWRVGRGTAQRLATYGVKTMGQLARMSITHEDFLYKLFGVNAELLIDHAWGYEPCTIEMVRAYTPESSSLCSGQVLKCPYTYDKARVVVQEMADAAALELVEKRLVTSQLTLMIGYDAESLTDPAIKSGYDGAVAIDHYGRQVPQSAHGSINLPFATSSSQIMNEAILQLYGKIVNPALLIRRISITTANVVPEELAAKQKEAVQLDLFADNDGIRSEREKLRKTLERERRMQEAVLNIKKQYGKNSLLKGLNLAEGSTAIERNGQIGGHKA